MRRALLVVLLATACDTSYDVTMTLSDAAVARGFGCTNDAGFVLAERVDPNQATGVLDVIDLGTSILSCRATDVLDYCAANACTVVRRACYPISAGDAATPAAAFANVEAELRGADAGIASLPTDRTFIVRFYITSQAMGACDPSVVIEGDRVGGCVYSCPAHLSASGDMVLDLDAPAFARCDQAVSACAVFERN